MYAWNSPFDGKLVSKCNWKSIFLGSSFMYSFTSWVVLVVNCFTSIVKKFNYFFNNFSFPCNTISTTAETSVCFLFLFFLLNPNSRFWNFIHEQYWSLFFFFAVTNAWKSCHGCRRNMETARSQSKVKAGNLGERHPDYFEMQLQNFLLHLPESSPPSKRKPHTQLHPHPTKGKREGVRRWNINEV